jgi:ABC-2 type transport system permease protein
LELLKKLGNVVTKELKELLRDPKILIGMIIVPLVMLPVIGFVIRGSMETTQQRLERLEIGILDFDGGSVTLNLISNLSTNAIVIIINASN